MPGKALRAAGLRGATLPPRMDVEDPNIRELWLIPIRRALLSASAATAACSGLNHWWELTYVNNPVAFSASELESDDVSTIGYLA